MSESKIVVHDGGTTFVGEKAVNLFRITAIIHGIRFYLKTGMKVNAAYTPTGMTRAAESITGKRHTGTLRVRLEKCEADLVALRDEIKETIPVVRA
jgi:hypothetical protein